MKIINYVNCKVTPSCCPPEMNKKKNPKLDKDNKKEYDKDLKIDITKALSYTCGKLIHHIIKMRKGNSNDIFWD